MLVSQGRGAGVAAAIMGLLKMTPMILVVPALIYRPTRVATLVTLIVVTGVSVILSPSAWIAWIAVLPNILRLPHRRVTGQLRSGSCTQRVRPGWWINHRLCGRSISHDRVRRSGVEGPLAQCRRRRRLCLALRDGKHVGPLPGANVAARRRGGRDQHNVRLSGRCRVCRNEPADVVRRYLAAESTSTAVSDHRATRLGRAHRDPWTLPPRSGRTGASPRADVGSRRVDDMNARHDPRLSLRASQSPTVETRSAPRSSESSLGLLASF